MEVDEAVPRNLSIIATASPMPRGCRARTATLKNASPPFSHLDSLYYISSLVARSFATCLRIRRISRTGKGDALESVFGCLCLRSRRYSLDSPLNIFSAITACLLGMQCCKSVGGLLVRAFELQRFCPLRQQIPASRPPYLSALSASKMANYGRIRLLNVEVDREDVSDYRMLVDGKSFKYITIDPGVYNPNEMTFDQVIIPQLPLMPEGDWNQGHITKHPVNGKPYFSQHTRVIFPTICSIWHPRQIDWLELEQAQWLRSNVYTANFKKSIGETSMADEIVIKFARFPWELQYYEGETRIYERIDGQAIGPQFLGHLTEEGRVIGLVIEYIKDARHAGPDDVEACKSVLRKLHQLGLLHGDVNRHNFLVREADGRKTATIIDFESASDCTDDAAFEEEIDRLREMLHSTDEAGGYYISQTGEEEQEGSGIS